MRFLLTMAGLGGLLYGIDFGVIATAEPYLKALGAYTDGEVLGNGHFATVWRQCGWDMNKPSYRESGWYDTQVSRDIQAR